MASRKAALAVLISGDASQLEKALIKAGGGLDKFGRNAEHNNAKVGSSFGAMAKRAVGAGIAAVGAYASISAAKGAIDTTETLAKTTLALHKNLGLSVAEASRWAAVAKSRDIDSKALNMSFGTLSKNIGTATHATQSHATAVADLEQKQAKQLGTAMSEGKSTVELNKLKSAQADALQHITTKSVQQAEAFKKLGVSQHDLKNSDFQTILLKTADGLQKMGPGAERTALSMKLFGRGWQTIVPVLRNGSKAMQEQLALADKYGVTFKGKTLKSLEDMVAAQRENKFAMMGLQVAFGTMLAPAITKGITGVNQFVVQMRTGTGTGGEFAKKLKDIWTQTKPIVDWLIKAGAAVAKFVQKHPEVGKLAAEVIAVGAGLKGLKFVSATTGFTDLLKVARTVVKKLVPLFAAEGAAAGTAFNISASGADSIGRAGPLRRAGRWLMAKLVAVFALGGAEAGVAAGTAAAGTEGLASAGVLAKMKNAGKLGGRAMAAGLALGALTALPFAVVEINKYLTDKLGLKGKTGVGGLFGGSPALGGGSGFGQALNALKGLFGGGDGGGKGSAALKGARSSLRPFASIGARFGLHVSSGRAGRENKLTSSGNVSYHSSGEAIDEADGTQGPSAAKLGYFNYLKSNYGTQLAELIYTPGGTGIKDGRPYKYTGQVAADHFDHVHVALDTGKPGVGDGLGKFVATSYGPPWGGIQGTGVTASGVNLKGNPHIYGVAADPSVLPLGSKVHIDPNPFGYRGDFKVFDTGGAIKGRRIDFYDWRGRKSQMSWGSRSVNVSTANGGGSNGSGSNGGGGATAEALQKKVDANQKRLDDLRNKLASLPKTTAGADAKPGIQAQIRNLVAANRTLRGDLKGAPTAQERQDAATKQGSRIVNAIANPFFRGKGGINALNKSIAGMDQDVTNIDTQYGQTSRRLDQIMMDAQGHKVFGSEDLGTEVGKKSRLGELAQLKTLKQAQVKRQQQRLKALNKEIAKYTGLIKALTAKLKGKNRPRGATAARIHKRLIDYENRKIELQAEAASLGSAITDTALDLSDLSREASDVLATPDTAAEEAKQKAAEAAANAPTILERTSDLTSLIDLKEHAGLLDAGAANQQRIDVITAAIQGKFGATTEREQLQLMGDLRDAQQASAQAVTDNTQALKDLQKSIDDNTAFAKSVMATENASLTRSIADLISGQIAGVGIAGRGLMPGTAGVRARY